VAGCGDDEKDVAGCGDEERDTSVTFAATSPRGGAPEPGSVEAAMRVMCERARALDVKARVTTSGPDRIEVQVDREADAARLAAPGRLAFYDWEPNVFGDPDAPLNDLDEAVRTAARVRPRAEATDVPSDRGNDAGGSKGTAPRGIAIVEAERPAEATPGAPAQYFVIEDDAELTGADIENPEQDFDPQTQEPIVTMDFTEGGRRAFARVTRRIARRGQEVLPEPGSSPQDRFQRFAITLDGRILSLAAIDFVANPEGISGNSGAQLNGLGSIEETQDLAAILDAGPLPVRLERVR
jgi:preprotein translocase subunit SecD